MSDKPLFDLEGKIREWIERFIEEAAMKWQMKEKALPVKKGDIKSDYQIEKTR